MFLRQSLQVYAKCLRFGHSQLLSRIETLLDSIRRHVWDYLAKVLSEVILDSTKPDNISKAHSEYICTILVEALDDSLCHLLRVIPVCNTTKGKELLYLLGHIPSSSVWVVAKVLLDNSGELL